MFWCFSCDFVDIFEEQYLQELSDFAVEIDILHEFSHKNIIKLYDAFFHDNKLWVSHRRWEATDKYHPQVTFYRNFWGTGSYIK